MADKTELIQIMEKKTQEKWQKIRTLQNKCYNLVAHQISGHEEFKGNMLVNSLAKGGKKDRPEGGLYPLLLNYLCKFS